LRLRFPRKSPLPRCWFAERDPQHTTKHCNALQHTATQISPVISGWFAERDLQHTATLCNSRKSMGLGQPVTHCRSTCNSVQQNESECKAFCNILLVFATLCLRYTHTGVEVYSDSLFITHTHVHTPSRQTHVQPLHYRVAKTHRIPYLYKSFSAKVTYI